MRSYNAKNRLNLKDDNELWALCRSLFRNDQGGPLELHEYELEIVKAILYKENKRNLCWATTRCGKSMSVGIATVLAGATYPGEKIRLIAPTVDHTRIVKGYVDKHILDHQMLIDSLSYNYRNMGVEHLKNELSKERVTFKNGSEIMTLTANILGEGRSLVGFGGSLLIVDEGEQIPDEIMRTKVMRMLGDSPNSMIFIIGNPVQPGFMYNKMKDSNWRQIHIGWERCVQAGRFSKDYIDEMRASMTSIEFDIWYNAIYPPEGEDTLIPWPWIERARNGLKDQPAPAKESSTFLGVDVASMGSDWTVFTRMEYTLQNVYVQRDVHKTSKTDTMKTVGRVIDLDRTTRFNMIGVDFTGLGTGVVDRLKEQEIGGRVQGIHFGQAPVYKTTNKHYQNLKAEMYFHLRRLFETNKIFIMDDPKLLDELSKLRFEFNSKGKIQIIDPDDHSPDEADSLALACFVNTMGIDYSRIPSMDLTDFTGDM